MRGSTGIHSAYSFRTYFPDAYKQHYPNAKTHLSSKIRSTLPDGTSLFEKTRGKKRRPFTLEEDEALKAGYEKHGTVWATIVKDPAFQAQGRKSTDLRDRFRNAFPELYQLAGYKPRSSAKKKLAATALAAAAEPLPRPPARFTQDDQAVGRRSSGPIRRRRALTNEGLTAPQLARQGSQSVPESSANSDDEDGPESEDEEDLNLIKHSHSQQTSTSASSSSAMLQPSMSQDMDMDVPPLVDDFLAVSLLSDAPPWSASIDTANQQIPSWATPSNLASPSISHLSGPDYFRHSLTMSPVQRPTVSTQPATIGKSAWPTQDWLTSANPRLEHTGGISSSASSFTGFSPVPSSPFSLASASFSAAASHGVLDRYDLPAPAPGHFSSALSAGTGGWGGDFISEVGPGDSHSTFSDPDSFAAPFRGFTHHSSYAGDLIFGARTHQPLAAGSGHAFGFGGLGLTGTSSSGHRAFSGTHTPALPGIEEAAALGAINLNDPADLSTDSLDAFMNNMMEHHDSHCQSHTVSAGVGTYNNPHDNLEQLINLPPSTTEPEEMEMRITPPGTPIERARRTTMTPHTAAPGTVGAPGFHNRSISVPPAEHRHAALLAPPGSGIHLRPPLTPTRSMSLLEPLSGGGHYSLDGTVSYPAVDPTTGHSLGWNPGEIPYLDMHYYTHGYGFDGFNPHGTPGEAGALDLAVLNNPAPSTPAPALALPSSTPLAGPTAAASTGERPWQLKRHVPQSFSVGLPPYSFSALQPPGPTPQVQTGRAALAQTLPSAATPTRPNHSMHHRVQSAVSPQDLMLRPEGQRRMSWDGGPP
jgi:hypothetical protein